MTLELGVWISMLSSLSANQKKVHLDENKARHEADKLEIEFLNRLDDNISKMQLFGYPVSG